MCIWRRRGIWAKQIVISSCTWFLFFWQIQFSSYILDCIYLFEDSIQFFEITEPPIASASNDNIKTIFFLHWNWIQPTVYNCCRLCLFRVLSRPLRWLCQLVENQGGNWLMHPLIFMLKWAGPICFVWTTTTMLGHRKEKVSNLHKISAVFISICKC